MTRKCHVKGGGGGGGFIKLLTRQRANTFRSEREREKERDMVMSITLYVGAWYQQGHGHISVVYGMFHMAIHLLKDLVLWADMRLAGGVHRGKNME